MKSCILVVVLFLSTSCFASPPLVPDPQLTPGDILTTDLTLLCRAGYTKTVRHVPQSLKNKVYKEYGITKHKTGEYEIDHLVSLQLGGSNSIRNLWPQSYTTTPNARTKDILENKLHRLVCAHKMTIEQAQHDIAVNWMGAYQLRVGKIRRIK